MAKKNNSKVNISNEELKPQVIGEVTGRKSNIGRVIIIFIAFIVAVFYLPDITITINKLLGMHTSPTITKDPDKNNEEKKSGTDKDNHDTLNAFSPSLAIEGENYTLNNFQLVDNTISFNFNNSKDTSIDYSPYNFYFETYSESKTLLERFKVDIGSVNAMKNEKVSFALSNPTVSYVSFVIKTTKDYPIVELKKDELGYGTITCKKGYETLIYTFKNNELVSIKDEIVYNFSTTDANYTTKFNEYQTKCTELNNEEGIKTTFNSSINGFSGIIDIDLAIAKINELNEKYYYNYKEEPKVVNFEMQTYGFTCN